jgi:hypothetical protein
LNANTAFPEFCIYTFQFNLTKKTVFRKENAKVTEKEFFGNACCPLLGKHLKLSNAFSKHSFIFLGPSRKGPLQNNVNASG